MHWGEQHARYDCLEWVVLSRPHAHLDPGEPASVLLLAQDTGTVLDELDHYLVVPHPCKVDHAHGPKTKDLLDVHLMFT